MLAKSKDHPLDRDVKLTLVRGLIRKYAELRKGLVRSAPRPPGHPHLYLLEQIDNWENEFQRWLGGSEFELNVTAAPPQLLDAHHLRRARRRRRRRRQSHDSTRLGSTDTEVLVYTRDSKHVNTT